VNVSSFITKHASIAVVLNYMYMYYLGGNVEPPLTNVFTMQWFLTMFATCLPMATVLKIWDCVMLDGSEILIRTALALWTKLAKYDMFHFVYVKS